MFLSCRTVNHPSEETLKARDDLRSRRSYFYETWQEGDDVFNKYYSDILDGLPYANYYPLWFYSNKKEMNAIIFEPEVVVKGTVLVIHGYAGNTLGFKYIINKLLKEGYRVTALSLPGHELASGNRGDIDNFNSYGLVIKDFIDLLKIKDIEPNFAITHSTGCTSLIIYNQFYEWSFKKVVFIAPLIRSSVWYPSKFIRMISKLFIDSFRTQWTGPLAVENIPMHWFDKLISWNKEFKDYYIVDNSMLLLQGEDDTVVDWKYNISAIKEKYPNTTVVKFKDGTHTMFMKNSGLEMDVSRKILEYFEN